MKILALIDGSKWGHKAALHAVSIAKRKKDAEIVLLSVMDRREARVMAFNYCTQSNKCDIIGTYEQNIWDSMHQSIKGELEALKLYCAEEGCQCTTRIAEGSRKEEITGEINAGGYSLVVMGAHGRTGRLQLGSTLGEICGEITAPVLIVH